MTSFNRNFAAAAAAALVAAAFAVPASAHANGAQASTPRASNASTDRTERAGERRICVREAMSGSRMPRRVCKTEREWAAEAGDNN